VRYQIGLDTEKPFDAVILDLTIPGGMGGLETIRRLREIDPRVNAAISSGYTTDPIATDFRSAGFKAFIAKPYAIKALEEVLVSLR
jgi:CheY-like chemotaxis protein